MNVAFTNVLNRQNPINLLSILTKSEYPKSGLFKCRIVYDSSGYTIEYIPYEARHVKTLKVVYDNDIHYNHKFENRAVIHSLFDQRQFCDDVLIIKNGFVTDSSYSNIIFYDGYQWVTPDTPLLKGTMRQMLIDAAEIKVRTISLQDIPAFKSFRLINAMLGFDGPEIDVSGIVF
jgi:4-amino-4-deoxychorismate lyase